MKNIRYFVISALTAALLTACGGSDPYVPGLGSPSGGPTTKGTFTAVVSFGDSLSDIGAYTPATSVTGDGKAPYVGGKFTTNSATGTVWVENIATSLGIVVTPAEVGFAGVSAKCPAAAVPALAATCTGYGQGGSRVTDVNGIGHAGGALTVPVKTQIANHLARFTAFKDSDLIFVFAGANDVFTQFGIFGAAAAAITADFAAGKITQTQEQNLLLQAQLSAQAGMKQAAVDLGGYIRTEILAKGGKYVVVMNLPDIVNTPFGQSAQVPASVRPTLTALSETFNLWIREEMTGQPVQLIDNFALFADFYKNPSTYGLTNVAVPACDAVKIAAITGGKITDGSSLFCNSTPGLPWNGLRTGADVNTWLFSDAVHPTTGGHKVFSGELIKQIKAFGWI
jgi:phospholipase/lecithinase/hemolysin